MTKQQLIEENINLVYFIINTYYPHHINDDDIIQAGMLGLCKAADTWNEGKAKFSTYATKGIRNAITREFRYRNKFKGVLSLDYEYNSDLCDGDMTALGDMIAGDVDVGFDYSKEFCDTLSPRQLEIVDLRRRGFSVSEIGRRFGVKRQAIWNSLRFIKRRWDKYNG